MTICRHRAGLLIMWLTKNLPIPKSFVILQRGKCFSAESVIHVDLYSPMGFILASY